MQKGLPGKFHSMESAKAVLCSRRPPRHSQAEPLGYVWVGSRIGQLGASSKEDFLSCLARQTSDQSDNLCTLSKMWQASPKIITVSETRSPPLNRSELSSISGVVRSRNFQLEHPGSGSLPRRTPLT